MIYDFTIVGAGIVGLSTAYKLSLKYPEAKILILEKEDRVAAHQTGKNSGVIHSGIYYKPGSYKAKNCIDGRRQMVKFCTTHDIAIDVCGKIIVATDEEELPRLMKIFERGRKNGIEDIELIDQHRLKELEPHVMGVAAIHVPCAGIVDYAGMCRKLMELLQEKNGEVRFAHPVSNICDKGDKIKVEAGGKFFETEFLINCAGLYSDHVAKFAGIHSAVKIVPFKGEYYHLKSEAEHLVNNLVYPLPNPEFPFLGVHFTRMALGGIECGPNAVFAFKREGYKKLSFNLKETTETINFPGFWRMARKHWRMAIDEYKRSFSKKAFTKGLQKLIPEIRAEHLQTSPAGIRAMALQPNGEILDDFYYEVVNRQIHVLNAPSPAATAGLAIGDEIVRKVEQSLQVA